MTTRGWMHDGVLTPAGSDARLAIEEATDRTQDALLHRLGDGLSAVMATADAVSAAIMAAQAFPADPRKRAAG